MARLIFYDDTHTYVVDGEEYPSVSEVSRFASREIYGEVSQYNLDNACSRGSAVHKATEILDKYKEVECAEDIVPYIKAYVQFRKDFSIGDYFGIEKALANKELKYAGTIDRIYTIDENFCAAVENICKSYIFIGADGKVEKLKTPTDLNPFIGELAILDLKTSSSVQNVLALIQLNAYKLSVEANGLGTVKALFILHLGKDGKYKLIQYEINPDLFKSCLTLHKALKKNKRKKENTENE
jgi:hypothetical protein